MKSTVVYLMVFILAFLFVTSAIVYLNQKYVNIFKLDFREANNINELAKQKLTDEELKKLRDVIYKKVSEELRNSIKREKRNLIDSLYKSTIAQNKTKLDELSDEFKELTKMKKEIVQKDKRIEQLQEQNQARQDSIYNEWINATVKLYESMDSRDAAKFIQNYSDNVARDLIYAMKRKKAAAILSNLSPDLVINLTQAK